jgi:predicted lactoylglutathione lyase
MMTKELWINLPVQDIARSREFFGKLGFEFHPRRTNNDEMAALMIGDKKVMVMLFPEAQFRKFTGQDIPDTTRGTEVLFSIDAASREEVDGLIRKAEEAGAHVFGRPQAQGGGWMYGAGFADPDGHRWNVLYMDMEQMPKE